MGTPRRRRVERSGDADVEVFEASEGQSVAPGWFTVEQFDGVESLEELCEDNLSFHAGEVGAEAVVDAGGEAQERDLGPLWLEGVWVGNLSGVAVGGCEHGDDSFALGDAAAGDLGVLEQWIGPQATRRERRQASLVVHALASAAGLCPVEPPEELPDIDAVTALLDRLQG